MSAPHDQEQLRLSRHLDRLLLALQERRQLTGDEVRTIAGSRGMARVWDLTRKGYDITVQRADGSTWLVTYHGKRTPGAQAALF